MTIAHHPSSIIDQHARTLLGASVTWDCLSGGRTNTGWVGRSKTRAIVYKIYRADRANPLFPNDSDHEWACLSALTETGLVPRPIDRFGVGDDIVVAYEFVAGTTFTQTTPDVMQALYKLHIKGAPAGLRVLDSGADRFLEMGDQFLETVPMDVATRVRANRPILRPLDKAAPVFLHGDPVPANVIKTQTGVCFLDWQCPAIGDAVEDIYVALSPAMHLIYGSGPLSKAEEESVLNAYPDAATVARFRTCRPFLAWRMAAYCAWKAAHGEAEYAACVEIELSRT
ncbi:MULTISPECIES: phosphotransferase [Alphaproteobacteria]|uniref:phosphotransferase n=1 Tax=Alphaproteobacteria TaxID=28211 RepID=UPI003A93CF23